MGLRLYNEEASHYESDFEIRDLLESAYTISQDLLDSSSQVQHSVGALIRDFMRAADAYYMEGRTLLNEREAVTEYRLQTLVQRMRDEWAVIWGLLSGVNVLGQREALLNLVNKIAQAILKDLKLEDTRSLLVLPHVNRNYELIHFHFSPYIKVIGIPVSSLSSVWNWTVIWHEVAGLVIEQYRNELLADVRSNLEQLQADGRPVLAQDKWHAWIYEALVEQKKHLDASTPFFSMEDGGTDSGTAAPLPDGAIPEPAVADGSAYDENELLDIGERVAQSRGKDLRQTDMLRHVDIYQKPINNTTSESAGDSGNSTDSSEDDDPTAKRYRRIIANWLEELIEDAVSVMCLGPAFVNEMEHILRKYYATDLLGDARHPSIQLRVAVAYMVARNLGYQFPNPPNNRFLATDNEAMDQLGRVVFKAVRTKVQRFATPDSGGRAFALGQKMRDTLRDETFSDNERIPHPAEMVVAFSTAFRLGQESGRDPEASAKLKANIKAHLQKWMDHWQGPEQIPFVAGPRLYPNFRHWIDNLGTDIDADEDDNESYVKWLLLRLQSIIFTDTDPFGNQSLSYEQCSHARGVNRLLSPCPSNPNYYVIAAAGGTISGRARALNYRYAVGDCIDVFIPCART